MPKLERLKSRIEIHNSHLKVNVSDTVIVGYTPRGYPSGSADNRL